MGFTWSDDLRTGIAEIDAQHKALIAQFNELVESCRLKKGKQEVARFLTFLTGYVHRHFDDEEQAMEAISYTGLERHREQHAKYREKLESLKDDLNAKGSADEVVQDAVWTAAEWFVDHIRQADMAMAGALRSTR